MSEKILRSDPVGLVEYIARNLVKHPDDVEVVPVWSPTSLIIELHVNNIDIGAVIGRNGKIARALRTLLSSISVKKIQPDSGEAAGNISKVVLEIIDQ
ncbi:MAG: KH domain-containing protein [Spirochaetia bacterium]|nr:KH domain-containing protein [Spirochaetia bacterium]